MFILFDGKLFNSSTVATIEKVVNKDAAKPYGLKMLTNIKEVLELYESKFDRDRRFDALCEQVGCNERGY